MFILKLAGKILLLPVWLILFVIGLAVKMTVQTYAVVRGILACWVYVQKYVKQKTLDEMLQELPGAGQFIIVIDTWFE